MFSIEFLNKIRSHEFETYIRHFPKHGRVLEIGGGTGAQAKLFHEYGYEIESIDVAESVYAEDRVHEVKLYDGYTIPFEDDSFDLIFSSNVLEHIAHLPEFHHEMKRVLKPGGNCIHIMPTAAWTFWTIVTSYLNAMEQAGRSVARNRVQALPDGVESERTNPPPLVLRRLRLIPGTVLAVLKTVFRNLTQNHSQLVPSRHGEFGNVFTELYTFSRYHWNRHFRKNGYQVVGSYPMGLFYTGYMFFGDKWSLKSREKWSRLLGSACVLYKVQSR